MLNKARHAAALLAVLGGALQAAAIEPVVSDHLKTVYAEVRKSAAPRGIPIHEREWKILQRPTGGLVGHVLLDRQSPAATARLRVFEVKENDLFRPSSAEADDQWFAPSSLIKPGTALREMVYEESRHIEPNATAVPVILPRNVGKGLKRCTFELLNPQGDVLYHCTPAEVFTVNGKSSHTLSANAWIASHDEAAANRMQKKEGLRRREFIKALPDDWRHYTDLQAIWVDEHTQLPAETLRRFVLTGGSIFARPEHLPILAGRLDIPPDTPILGGGLRGLDDGKKTRKKRRPGKLAPRQPTVAAPYQKKFLNAAVPLENEFNLFGRIKLRMIVFTAGVAVCYALAVCIVLPLLFLRQTPEKRTALWWKIPAATLAATLLTLAVARGIILPKQPISEITEYRFGYGDWPEVFCHTDAAALKYGRKPFGWMMPAGGTELLLKAVSPKRSINQNNVIYADYMMGNTVRSTFAHFLPMRQPFHAERIDGTLHITTDRRVRNCYVVCGMQSELLRGCSLGTLQPGQPVAVPPDDHAVSIDGTPYALRNTISLLKKDDRLPIFGNAVFIIALDAEAPPTVSALNGDANQRGRAAWIVQIPLKGGA